MLQLIIIDDESATRNGLLRHIDWEQLGISMLQTAGSGQEALTVCEEFEPDIILSDIRMRGMNGVETCRVLRERYPDAQIVFLSGYSDKEYLKAAIELGAVNYVEKPVNFGELERAVGKAAKAVNEVRKNRDNREMALESQEYLRRKVFFALLEPTQDLMKYIDEDLERSKLFSTAPAYMRVLVLKSSAPVTNVNRFLGELDKALAVQGEKGKAVLYRAFKDNRHLLLLLGGEQGSIANHSQGVRALCAVVEKGLGGLGLFLALGDIVREPLELPHSYATAQSAEESLFHLGYGQCGRPKPDGPIQELEGVKSTEFARILTGGEKGEITIWLEEVARYLRDQRAANSPAVRNLILSLDHEITLQLRNLYPDTSRGSPVQVESDFAKLEAIDTIEDMVKHLTERARALLSARAQEEDHHSTVAQVVRIIQQRYGDKGLSVRQLAEEVYLTPTYLSALFKRKTGKTIGEYLVGVRMERARELLKDNGLKLYHVAAMVGYEDANYFAKIFKKYIGVTPSEYRDKMW